MILRRRVGPGRRWVQHKPSRQWLAHYALPAYGSGRAIALGATPVGRAEIVAVIRRKRAAFRSTQP